MIRTYKLLGSLTIEENGRSSPIMKYRKGRALLAYLIITRQAHSREAVADLLWNASSTAQSFRNLRKLLHQIRPHAPNLQITQQELTYQPNDDVEIDLYTLEEALTSQNIDQLDQALALYKGDLLADFYLEDRPEFNEWLLLEREQLRQRVWAAYEQLCAVFDKQQQWQRGIEATRRWLKLDSLDEAIHRRLMQFLAADGQIEVALQQYELCREELWREQGVEPSAATQALAKQLRQQQWPETNQLAELGHLPEHSCIPYHHNPTFVGRTAEMQQLGAYLRPSQKAEDGLPKTAVVTGMGGVGKSQLAVEFAYRYGRYFPGGVYWLSFADPETVADEIAAIGGERGMRLYGEADGLPRADQTRRVQRAWQESIPRLLIFDNCESEELLAQWRPVTGGCRVLVTSRRGQWTPELAGTTFALTVLARTESTSLLQQLAPRLEQAEAEAIAAEVVDYPLALHLAGSFLQRYQLVTTAVYLSQLRDKGLLEHPSLQGHGLSYSPTGRELHVVRTLAINSEQLYSQQPVDQMALRLLAAVVCFAPGEPVPQTILYSLFNEEDDPLTLLHVQDGLSRLSSLGLIQFKGDAVIVLHRILAAYAKEVLLPPVLLNELAMAVETNLIGRLTEQTKGMYGLATLPISSPHLHHIVENAQQRADRRAIQLLVLWGCHQRDRGSHEAAEQSFQSTLLLQAQLDDTDDLAKMEMLHYLGNLYIWMGRYVPARSCFERYLSILEQNPQTTPLQLARGIYELGYIYASLGTFEIAQEYLERAVSLYQEHLGPDEPPFEYYLSYLAIMHLWKGDYQLAKQLALRKLQAAEAMLGKDHLETVAILNFLGECHFCLGRVEEALVMYKQAAQILEQRGALQHSQTAYNRTGFGQIALMRGQLAEAQQYFEEGLAIRARIRGSQHKYTAQSLIHLGNLHLKSSDYDKAKTYLDRALAIRQREFGAQHPETAECLVLLGEWHLLAQNDTEKAKSLFEQALTTLATRVVPTHLALQRVQRNLAMLGEQLATV